MNGVEKRIQRQIDIDLRFDILNFVWLSRISKQRNERAEKLDVSIVWKRKHRYITMFVSHGFQGLKLFLEM